MMHSPRGFALVIALILTSVVLAVGVALVDLAVKQLSLASSSKNSQYAFYNADSGLECALYYDQKVNVFYYNSPITPALECNGLTLSNYAGLVNYSVTQDASNRTTTFNIPCSDSSGIIDTITIIKSSSGTTDIYSNGYNTCNANSQTRIERGVKIHY